MICALKGSSVVLTCPVPSWTQVTEIVWFNQWLNGKSYDLRWDPKYEGRVEYSGTTEKDCILRITDLREIQLSSSSDLKHGMQNGGTASPEQL